jgi:hypothetical protein
MPLRFFNIDLHVSVIEDVKTIWKQLFSNIEIVDWSISGHAHLFPHTISNDNPILNRHTWRQFDPLLIHTFVKQYESFLSEFDGFLVTHTPIFAMLFEKFEKPIIIVNSCRYHQPICWNHDRNMLEMFHKTLDNLSSKHLLTIVHNNRADEEFFNDMINNPNIPQYYIPSLCQYIQCTYDPIIHKILIDDPQNILHNFQSPHLHRKSGSYEWKQLYQHQAVIVIPREVSYMTFFEYIQACIPIILPTKRFMFELIEKYGLRLGTLHSYHMEGDLKPWIENADYFQKEVNELCISFDSFDHLHEILSNPNLPIIIQEHHLLMIERRKLHIVKVFDQWSDIFHINFFEFINYNFWPCLAKFHLDSDYSNEVLCRPFYKYRSIEHDESLNSLKNNDLIFIKTDMLHRFMLFVLPKIKCRYRLLIGVSDMSPSNFHIRSLIDDPLCTHVYSTNLQERHPKLTPIPIGFSEPMRPNGSPNLLRKWLLKSEGSSEKEIDLFIRKFSITNVSRKHYEEELNKIQTSDRKFLNIVQMTFATQSTDELHEYLRRSKFAVVLRGNGIDTHYMYECILNECVPIFLNNTEFPLYKQYASCIQVQSIDQLHRDYPKHKLESFYEQIDWKTEKNILFRKSYQFING